VEKAEDIAEAYAKNKIAIYDLIKEHLERIKR